MFRQDSFGYQSQIANVSMPIASFLAVEAYTPKEGDLLSSLLHAMFGEAIPAGAEVTRNSFLEFPFDPPRLRTVFFLNDMILTLPSLGFETGGTIAKLEITVELGWIGVLASNRNPLYSEAFTAGVETLKKSKIEEEAQFFVPPITRTIQFQPQFTIYPGMNFEVFAVPYYRMINVKEYEANSSTFLRAAGSKGVIPFKATRRDIATCTMVYSMTYNQNVP